VLDLKGEGEERERERERERRGPGEKNERVDQDLTGWVDPGPDKTFQAQNQGGLTLQVGSPIT
jgi:hypothetical protein